MGHTPLHKNLMLQDLGEKELAQSHVAKVFDPCLMNLQIASWSWDGK